MNYLILTLLVPSLFAVEVYVEPQQKNHNYQQVSDTQSVQSVMVNGRQFILVNGVAYPVSNDNSQKPRHCWDDQPNGETRRNVPLVTVNGTPIVTLEVQQK
jgi:hypothetical protein